MNSGDFDYREDRAKEPPESWKYCGSCGETYRYPNHDSDFCPNCGATLKLI